VEAPDWDPTPECGKGLHGFLNGCGNGALADWDEFAKWLVVEVDSEVLIDLKGKIKFPKGDVVFCGTRLGAIAKLEALAPETKHMPVIGAMRVAGDNMQCHAGDRGTATAGEEGKATASYKGTAIAGDYGTATADYGGTATAGEEGKATAGDFGTATAGVNGTATAGDGGTATAGENGTATAGDRGTATAGHNGTATAGNEGTATAGHNGTAIADEKGKATAGNWGTAIAGIRGTATAGAGGRIFINWWDEKAKRLRTTIGYVGEDGIQANIPYQCNTEGKLIPA